MAKYDPYIKCTKCEAVTRKSNMARHIKIKHKGFQIRRKVYQKMQCYCGKAFSPNHLKSHWSKHHQDHASYEHYRWEIKRRIVEAGRTFSEFFVEHQKKRKLTKMLKMQQLQKMQSSNTNIVKNQIQSS